MWKFPYTCVLPLVEANFPLGIHTKTNLDFRIVKFGIRFGSFTNLVEVLSLVKSGVWYLWTHPHHMTSGTSWLCLWYLCFFDEVDTPKGLGWLKGRGLLVDCGSWVGGFLGVSLVDGSGHGREFLSLLFGLFWGGLRSVEFFSCWVVFSWDWCVLRGGIVWGVDWFVLSSGGVFGWVWVLREGECCNPRDYRSYQWYLTLCSLDIYIHKQY